MKLLNHKVARTLAAAAVATCAVAMLSVGAFAADVAIGEKAQAVGDVSRELKILTKELGCPIIALSQLNRANEQRSDKRPTLADLRDSGAIEQDADSVMFIHNEDAYRKDKSQPPTGKVEILLPKSRFSQTGTMFLKFQPEYMKFSNWNVKKDPFNRSKNSAAVWDKPDENDKENAKTGEAEKEEK